MKTGTVRFYNEGRGKGIIVCDGDGKRVAVSHGNIAGDGFKILYEGQRVEFEIALTAKGPFAHNVVSRHADER